MASILVPGYLYWDGYKYITDPTIVAADGPQGPPGPPGPTGATGAAGGGFTAGGDLSGTTTSQTVEKIKTKSLAAALSTIGAAQDGYVLTWVNGSSEWQSKALPSSAPSGAAGGDLTGTYPNPTVVSLTGSGGLVTIGNTTSLLQGANPSTDGYYRVSHGFTLHGRNSLNTLNRNIIDFGSTTTDVITIGDLTLNSTLKSLSLTRFDVNASTPLLVGDGYIQMGGTVAPALTGDLRVKQGFKWVGRNAANSADQVIWEYGTVGNTLNTNVFMTISGGVNVAGGVGISSGGITWGTTNTPSWSQAAVSGNAHTTTISAQSSNAANGNGGALILQSGQHNGSGLPGALQLTMDGYITIEQASVIAGQRIISLNRGVAITSTQMPVNTGDLVTYIGQAATNPTANPVSGGILYVKSDGYLNYRAPDGTMSLGDRTNTTKIDGYIINLNVNGQTSLNVGDGYIAVGITPALTTGAIRLPYNTGIYTRNSGNTADHELVINTGGQVQLASYNTLTNVRGSTQISINTNSGHTSVISQETRNSVIHNNFYGLRPTIFGIGTLGSDQAPLDGYFKSSTPFASATGTNRNSGNVILEIPAPISGGAAGHVRMNINGTNQFVAYDGYVMIGNSTGAFPTTGNVRIGQSAWSMYARNSINTLDQLMISTNGGNVLSLGSVTGWGAVSLNGPSISFNSGGAAWGMGISGFISSGNGTGTQIFGWGASTLVAPTIIHNAATGSVAGLSMTIRAQDGGQTGNQNGGPLLLQGGTHSGTGLKGGIRIGIDGYNLNTMIEATELVAGQRILALNRGTALTTTEMPTNTGDYVTYIGNAATSPTANPASGLIMYSNSDGYFNTRSADGYMHLGDVLNPMALNGSSITIQNNTPIYHGTNPALTGDFRIKHNWSIKGRNNINTADIGVLDWGATTTNVVTINTATTIGGAFVANSTMSCGSTFSMFGQVLGWGGGASAPIINQGPQAGNAKTFTIISQASSSANGNGGNLVLASGLHNGTGLAGAIQHNMDGYITIEQCQVVAGQRIVALNRASAMTSTQMPSNTGDLVTFIGDAATAPTASPVSGLIMYSTAGKFGVRSSAGGQFESDFTTAATASSGGTIAPANIRGFIVIKIGGVDQKIPYYDV